MQGSFIVIEGPDGAGTTTHSRLLAERLEQSGKKILRTSEPSDGPIGLSIREYLHGGNRLPPSALQLLFSADRAWHVETVIEPALREGTTVICDRYIASTIVYGALQGISKEWLQNLNSKYIQPDCQLLLLPSVDICMARLQKRAKSDIFETRAQQEKIHGEYRAWATENPAVQVIDSGTMKEDVAAEIHHMLCLSMEKPAEKKKDCNEPASAA